MRILGLDIGSSSIKAVEIDASFGRYEVREYYETAVQPGQVPVQAAASLVQGLARAPDRIVVSMPPQLVTQRNLKVPTRDKKAIKAAVTFELEDDLPFDLETAAYDSSVLSQGSEGSQIHISVSLKKHLADFLAQLKQVGIDPDIVTSECWAFRTYLNRITPPGGQDAPVMLVNIGANLTSIYVQHEGVPLFEQMVPWGGNDLTFAIAEEYGLSPVDAERAKCERGLLVPGSEADQSERIECKGRIVNVLNRLLLEMRQAILSCKSFTQQSPRQIYFAGGGSLAAGLGELLAPELHINIQPLQSLSAISLSGVSYSEQADATFLLAASLGLCLVGQGRSTAINFRRGEFSKAGVASSLDLTSLKGPLTAAGVIAGCLLVSLVTESIIYKSKIKKENAALEKSMKGFFPTLSPSAARNFLTSTTKLREAIKKELDTVREAAVLYSPHPRSPMVLLKTLSQNVPASVVVDMIRFQAGSAVDAPYKADAPSEASLTFIVANPQTIEKLGEALGKFLSGIQKSKIEEVQAPDGSGKKLKVTFSGKPTESAYGK
jgi:type IV pilus assembly protein PilM